MLKLVAFVALFAGLCWFGTTVPLGAHTLFGHLHAISETKESQELFDGTRQSAKPLVDNVRRRIAGLPESDGARPEPIARAADGGPPQENVSASDRRRLRKLLSAADHTTSSR